ncbi:unnamed protein product [Pleuronectes platessa]|uniref:Uncharacterized protein n=1 Tax=Pleuronectes platessa TaxID=8262 RepID=A0A9N7Y3G1_PLEPL|nr:unnamed protein product [Pleuronectes platessa]
MCGKTQAPAALARQLKGQSFPQKSVQPLKCLVCRAWISQERVAMQCWQTRLLTSPPSAAPEPRRQIKHSVGSLDIKEDKPDGQGDGGLSKSFVIDGLIC